MFGQYSKKKKKKKGNPGSSVFEILEYGSNFDFMVY